MIRLTRGPVPDNLTPAFVAENTQRYIDSKRTGKEISVWNHDWLKEALKEFSHHKCAYCEVSFLRNGTYMEVEHFRDKKDFENEVLDWNNLLPACKTCNTHKSSHNVVVEPIVNPCVDNPSDHLYIENYRIKWRDGKGKATVETLCLNDTEKLCMNRFSIGEELHKKIEEGLEKVALYRERAMTRRKNALINLVKDILRLCQPEEEYSATCATVVHSDDTFSQVVSDLNSLGFWDDELESLFRKSYEIRLCK